MRCAGIGDPDDPEVLAPGEIRGVDMGSAPGDSRDRAEGRRFEQAAKHRLESRLADPATRARDRHRLGGNGRADQSARGVGDVLGVDSGSREQLGRLA